MTSSSAPPWQPSSVALSSCAQSSALLLLLLHPAPDVLDPPQSSLPQPSAALLARCATRSLHRVLFADRRVLDALRESRVHCVLARQGALHPALFDALQAANVDVPHVAPALIVCSLPERKVLFTATGYVSPNTLLAVLPSSAHAFASHRKELTRSTLPAAAPAQSRVPPSSVKRELPAAALSLRAETPPRVRIRVRLPSGQLEHLEKPPSTPFSEVREHVASTLQAPPHHLQFAHAAPPNQPISVADDTSSLAELRLSPTAALIVSLRRNEITAQNASSASPLWARLASVRSVAGAFLSSFFAQTPDQTEQDTQRQTPSSRGASASPRPSHRLGDVRDNGNSTQFAYRPNSEEHRSPPP